MKIRTEDEPDLTLAEDTIIRARLEQVEYREFEWTDRRTGDLKKGEVLEWYWEITSASAGEQYVGRKIRGKCNPKSTNREGNRLREWSEALLDRQIPVGMEIDTDDLIGLEADVVIGIETDRKDPSRVWDRVVGVLPISGQSFDDRQPPF